MKIVARLLVLLPCFGWRVWAVDCAAHAYYLTSQAEIDALGATGCTRILNDLHIRDSTDIISLDALVHLESVGNDLYVIATNLDDLDGFINLESVSGDIFITNNSALRNIDGLAGITSISETYGSTQFHTD